MYKRTTNRLLKVVLIMSLGVITSCSATKEYLPDLKGAWNNSEAWQKKQKEKKEKEEQEVRNQGMTWDPFNKVL